MPIPLRATLDDARRVPSGPGDAPNAPAGAVFRFEEFTAGFGTWVMFRGPKGGENG
ncbi:hypothetical protein D3C83_248430 [compost metagenome]